MSCVSMKYVENLCLFLSSRSVTRVKESKGLDCTGYRY